MPNCKSCGADIRWVKTVTGANMPLDVKPYKMIFVDRSGIGSTLTVYQMHWASCPDAKKWKGKNKNAEKKG
jgi:hypothetical protein